MSEVIEDVINHNQDKINNHNNDDQLYNATTNGTTTTNNNITYRFSTAEEFIDWLTYGDNRTFLVVLEWLMYICSAPGMTLVGAFGSVTNAVNILVFYRQGIFVDSCTVSLTLLAVSDFCLCFVNFSSSVFFVVAYGFLMVDMEDTGLYYQDFALDIALVAPVFLMTTCWITVFIALERMVSVTFPFRVKSIFNPRRSCGFIGVMFIVSLFLEIPMFFKLPFFPETKFEIFMNELQTINDVLNNYAIRLTSIVLVFILNSVMVVKVILAKRFRTRTKTATTATKTSTTTKHDSSSSSSSSSSSTTTTTTTTTTSSASGQKSKQQESEKSISSSNSNSSGSTTNKELKLAVMVSVLCVMYFVCYTPRAVIRIAVSLSVPGLSILHIIMVEYLGKFLEAVNSSCNIIVYFVLSTKFRNELTQISCRGRDNNK